MQTVLGISCLGHDAGVAVVRGPDILFAAHAERYSRRKNDAHLNPLIIEDALQYCDGVPTVAYYERPWRRTLRHLATANKRALLSSWDPRAYIQTFLPNTKFDFQCVGHHLAHASGGFLTSPFDSAAVVVLDGVGEFDTATVWRGSGARLTRVWRMTYPHSLGLLYSAFTKRVGFRPNEEEFITMGLSAFGRPIYKEMIEREFFIYDGGPLPRLSQSVSKGIGDWHPELGDRENIAASIQAVLEDRVMELLAWVRRTTGCNKLVFSGGVALNCVLNSKIAQSGIFDDIWIMPNPGDAGSSLGAALAVSGCRANWKGPYLGHAITGELDVTEVVGALRQHKIACVARGRAEFGPRALGHRSLLADPRGTEIKLAVNRLKKREAFRPFAPMVLREHAAQLFDMPIADAPYMQYVAKCRFPSLYPAICHVDNTSRVQTVGPESPIAHALLTEFERQTGCPMLLNTSLNIKGEPLVNTRADAMRFSERYGVPVY